MKHSKVPNIFKKFVLSDFFEKTYYFFCIYVWIIFSIIGAGLGITAILLFLEYLFPQDVHLLNYALTDRTFKELYDNHNYHAAIFIAEGDTAYMNDNLRGIANKDMLRDCYLHVGEYSKAEKIGRDFLSLNPAAQEIKSAGKETEELAVKLLHAVSARDLFRLYEKMGDRTKQLEMYGMLKDFEKEGVFRGIEGRMGEYGVEMPRPTNADSEIFSIEHNFKYDMICGMYIEQPDAAIDSLHNFVAEVIPQPKFNPSLKLAFINRLISWHLERKEILKAQKCLLTGILVIPTIVKEEGLEPLGEFAEYCYILHDYKNARRFMNMYMRYMDNYYSDDDLDYLLAEARFIKYRQEGEDEFVPELIHCCRGLREQISKNFAGMSLIQQEYFAKKLSEPFSLALQWLDRTPQNKDLASLCFENEIFNRGLLLRSDALLRHALAESADSTLIGDYEKYITLKRELVARSEITGPGNFARRIYLEKEVSDLEKRLSEGCSEFTRSNNTILGLTDVESSLTAGEAFISYIEVPQSKGKTLAAFVLSRENGLSYIPLCPAETVQSLESSDVMRLCEDERTYSSVFETLESKLPQNARLYYSPTGVINRLPLAALYIDSERTLGEKYSLSLLSNPEDLKDRKSVDRLELDKMHVALWGGIEYGSSEEASNKMPLTRSIIRGNKLQFLPGSMAEVNDIGSVLNGKVKKIVQYTGDRATEQSFKSQASKADIIHVSTHGFFNEDRIHEQSNAMHNSGLFFANSNRAWEEDYRPDYYAAGYEDGILRADEIEYQNLSSCHLIVLSACETGLGEIKGNEGVFGLQRGFKLAGVKYILMSLWSVPDTATKELMKRFYANLITQRNIELAFNDAQRNMREERDSHTGELRYGIQDWGGFVLLR